MKTKWIPMIVAAALLFSQLSGCGENGNKATDTTQASESIAETKLPEATGIAQPTEATETQAAPLYCPWEYDVSAQADGKLHYYFMASGGYCADAASQKWGDATLIVFPDGTNMLVDSGQTWYTPVLLENLARMGVEKLDYLLLTHSHSDHINGAVCEGGLFDSIEIGKVYISGVYNGKLNLYNGRIEDPDIVEQRCAEKAIPVQILRQGDILTFAGVNMQILWPKQELIGQSIVGTEEVNNTSLVMRFSFGNHVSVFPGDLYESAEKELVQYYNDDLQILQAELLKLPHHGGKTSSSVDFATAILPDLVILSGYNALSGKVKSTYELCQSTILSDQKNGYIHVMTDGTQMTWETSQ